ncbi:MAG: hypothetical protein N2645_04490 [Clostridia bacterium]|nr:hypothetical protein [Clostridia bacterium]
MELEYTIVGGFLKIHKSIFVREMLLKESRLRELLNWKGAKDFAKGHPMVKEADSDGMVTIQFNSAAGVSVGESPKELLGELKAKYKEKMKGKVSCRGTYWTMVSFFEIDLNSEEDQIEYIMN